MIDRKAVRTVTREELYALVWETPMSRLALEFGVSGNGMAKACDRLDVPYPSRGYWYKKDAGVPVSITKLPSQKGGTLATTTIHPTPPRPEPVADLPQVLDIKDTVAHRLATLAIPEGLTELHPRVKAWIEEHKQEQRERSREAKKPDKFWPRPLLLDLTDRDLYRFRVSSALFEGLERVGGKIDASPISGKKIALRVDGHSVECTITEKMQKSLKRMEVYQSWTAYPDHHQGGLTSSGHLRVTIDTYVGGQTQQWVESDRLKIGQLLPEIIGSIMATGPLLTRRQRDEAIRLLRYREEEAQRNQTRLQKEIDNKRWSMFEEYAINWDQRSKHQALLSQLEACLKREGDVLIGDKVLTAWIDWARQRSDALDPLRDGAASMFKAISNVTP